MKLFNDLHYLPMSRSIFPLGFITTPPPHPPPPDSFCPLEIVKWSTLFSHVPYHFFPWIHFAPALFCPHIILPPPPIILPPGNSLMIFTIYPCSISFFPWIHFAPPPPPYHFAPWKSFNDLHYLPVSHIIFPPGFILPPYNFAPVLLCPPPYYFAPWK